MPKLHNLKIITKLCLKYKFRFPLGQKLSSKKIVSNEKPATIGSSLIF